MTVQDIVNVLEQKAPFGTAEEWDNVGLLVGDNEAEVSAVLVALDVTDEVIKQAIEQGVQLIVTHHPIIFDSLKALPSSHAVYRLAAAGIAVLSAHTNADKAAGGVNDCLCEKLGLTAVSVAEDGLCRIGRLPIAMSADAFAVYVANCLGTAVRLRAGDRTIQTVAVCGGSGGDLVVPLLEKADAAVTGEVKHHEWLGVPAAKTLVDAGHYATENGITERFAEWLRKALPTLSVTVHTGHAPYRTIEG